MRRTLAASLFLIILMSQTGCTMWPEKKNPNWDQATGLEQMERLYWKEVQAANWKEIEKRTASNYTHTSSQGVKDKQQRIAELQAAKPDEVSLGEFQVVGHGDTAIVSYVATERRQGVQVQKRRTSIWQQQKSGWVLIGSSEMGAASSQ